MEEVRKKKGALTRPRAAAAQAQPPRAATTAAATTTTTTSTTAAHEAPAVAIQQRQQREQRRRREEEEQRGGGQQKPGQGQQRRRGTSPPPPIQPSPSAGSTMTTGAASSLAYSLETEFMTEDAAAATTATTASGSSRGEVGAEHHRRQHSGGGRQQQPGSLATVEEYYWNNDHAGAGTGTGTMDGHHAATAARGEPPGDHPDATPTVVDMHRKLLHLLSRPELFAEAAEWQARVDRGIDPSGPPSGPIDDVGGGFGGWSFDSEFNDASTSRDGDGDGDGDGGGVGGVGGRGEDESKDASSSAAGGGDESGGDPNRAYAVDDGVDRTAAPARHERQRSLIPPLPLRIFAPDAEVVLPQAYTATQLFGIERITGIELEAAAGASGLCRLFQRWLALMPAGDHENVIDPPGVTVMRISGGRYRVTGAHRVVWRWMNKFSLPEDDDGATGAGTATHASGGGASPPRPSSWSSSDGDARSSAGGGGGRRDNVHAGVADFDFGDLVTMTIVDVFETDEDGKLLSYCPTFDNREVHRTQEVAERIRKGASLVRERMGVAARSPAGKSVNRVSRGKRAGGRSGAWKEFKKRNEDSTRRGSIFFRSFVRRCLVRLRSRSSFR